MIISEADRGWMSGAATAAYLTHSVVKFSLLTCRILEAKATQIAPTIPYEPLASGTLKRGTTASAQDSALCTRTGDQASSETKKPPFASRRKRVVPWLSPIPPAQDIFGEPSCLGILASVSTYSPRLPGTMFQWLSCGFRQRLQLRGSAGFSPASHKACWLNF